MTDFTCETFVLVTAVDWWVFESHDRKCNSVWLITSAVIAKLSIKSTSHSLYQLLLSY